MQISSERGRVIAVLGPTNTGKTHFAMERMLAFESGIIGFPLRLLARENYDRAVAIKGASQVALITGEEKIIPPRAKYFMCTAESMPLNRSVAFLALDEVQMCADPDRGHIFSERLLRARGQYETIFMGAETMRRVIRKLIPQVEFQSRPRMSTLSYMAPKNIARLPTRSALVAFTAPELYSIAELVRRQRGGAALVMGALSPRTRNAQVSMFQDGEVDFLVATDAIGMGLNMDINHVCFTATRKFDGRFQRPLNPAELAQIAGRAGRHMTDGSFGTTTNIGGFDNKLARAIEDHTFEPLHRIFWRNWKLDFKSTERLLRSLALASAEPTLVRAREADDERALQTLLKDAEIRELANTPDAVRLLWEVCCVPDFRKVMNDVHAPFLGILYRHLRTGKNRIPSDWMSEQINHHDRMNGDIDTLAQRIAGVRTLTYISYRPDWLANAAHWQERTRAIEDQLSDALHARLTQLFVDRKTTLLVKKLKDNARLSTSIKVNGTIIIEGHRLGKLDGFKFISDQATAETISNSGMKAINRTARQALCQEIQMRVDQFVKADDDALELRTSTSLTPSLFWKNARLAKIVKGQSIVHPQVHVDSFELLSSQQREVIGKRLTEWLSNHLQQTLRPIYLDVKALPQGPIRGIMWQLREHLGSMPRSAAANEITSMKRSDRQALRSIGVRIQRESILASTLLKPAAITLRGMLFDLHHERLSTRLPSPGRVSVRIEKDIPAAFYEAIGYRPLGNLAVRVDIVERLATKAWKLSQKGNFSPTIELMNLIGGGQEDIIEALKRLGYRQQNDHSHVLIRRNKPRPKHIRGLPAQNKVKVNPHSPFAKLAVLKNVIQ